MSTSTRRRTNQTPAFADNADATNPSDLPSSRPRKRALLRVSPPLSSLSLNKLIYILALFAVLLIAFYSYRMVQYKSQIGGWWNLALGRRPPLLQDGDLNSDSKSGGRMWAGKSGGGSSGSTPRDVEDRINALAEALGIPSKELASAVARAVKEHNVPPASLSSAATKETGGAGTLNSLMDAGEEEEEGSWW